MNKDTFLHQLRIRLSQLPEAEIEKRLDYYSEIIEDMKEDGISEEEAVASFGDINAVAQQIMQDVPMATLVKTKVKPKKGWTATAIVIAIVGSPLWLTLFFALAAVLCSVFVVIWAAIFCMFAAVAALGISGLFLLFKAFTLFSSGFSYVLFTVGAAFVLLGLCALGFLFAKVVASALIRLIKWIFIQIKGLFIRKEAA